MAIELTEPTTVVRIASEADLIEVRHTLRVHAEAVGMGLVDQTKLITAGSELARNILSHATGSLGWMTVERVHSSGSDGVKAVFTDEGPGIEDIEAALTDGFSTVGSLGLGLPGSKRLVDEMTVESSKGGGTTVVVVKWRR